MAPRPQPKPEYFQEQRKIVCSECPGRICNITNGKPNDCPTKPKESRQD